MKTNGFLSLVFILNAIVSSRVFAQESLAGSRSTSPTAVMAADPSVLENRSRLAPPKVSILPEERDTETSPTDFSGRSSIAERSSRGLSEKASSILKIDEMNSYSDHLTLREQRPIGLGGSLGGEGGMIGFRGEYNIDETQSGLAALGFGPGYQSFSFSYKRSWYGFLDTELSPYLAGGYSRWFQRGSGEWSGSDILRQALSDDQKNSNQFAVDFLPLSAGLQYYFLRGEMAGLSFFGEIVLLNQVQPTMQMILSGTLGAAFYF